MCSLLWLNSFAVFFIFNSGYTKGTLPHCSIIYFFNMVYKIQIISKIRQAPLTALALGTCKCSLRWGSSQQTRMLYWLSHTWQHKWWTREYHKAQDTWYTFWQAWCPKIGTLASAVTPTSTATGIMVIQLSSVIIISGNKYCQTHHTNHCSTL